jgi:hypothetical protein
MGDLRRGNDCIWVGSLPKVALFFEIGMTKRRWEVSAIAFLRKMRYSWA